MPQLMTPLPLPPPPPSPPKKRKQKRKEKKRKRGLPQVWSVYHVVALIFIRITMHQIRCPQFLSPHRK